MRKIILASGNPGKFAEIREVLTDLAIELIPQSAWGIDDIEESGLTFVENAILKARHASRLSGLPALADDSGICVDVLNGAPGLLSARYAGNHGDSNANIARLLDALRDVPKAQRTAHFHCTLVVLSSPDDPAPLIAEGDWHGAILESPRGDKGFGYDPIFFDPALERSAAELDPITKNRISHRGQALAQLHALMQDRPVG